jgi:hypothetical protein
VRPRDRCSLRRNAASAACSLLESLAAEVLDTRRLSPRTCARTSACNPETLVEVVIEIPKRVVSAPAAHYDRRPRV